MPRGVKRRAPEERPAVERGIPVKVVDALLDLLVIDEDEITLESKLGDDLGADSLDLTELAMELEAIYHVPIDDAIVGEAWSVGTVATMLDTLRQAGAAL